ncbi:AAA family ATPase [Pseudomonas cichorii]|nr:AAA family ATPase [Pseudomonas cichorii]MBX8554190.1 AAA family ATPase [Pseudomonas cichorii]
MEIKSFRLVNVGRFSDLEVALAPTQRHASRVTVLVGNNGAGKTTLLESLSTMLTWLIARIRSERGVGRKIDPERIKNGSDFAEMGLTLVEAFPFGGQSLCEWRLASVRMGRKSESRTSLVHLALLADGYRTLLMDSSATSLPLIAHYPAERSVIDIPLKPKSRPPYEQLDGYDDALSRGVDFRQFFEWFREREDRENEEGVSTDALMRAQEKHGADSIQYEVLLHLNTASRDRELTAVRSAITAFMPDFKNLRVRRKPHVHMVVNKQGEILDVLQLSQGEKSLMALVGDIARRLAMLNPALENPLHGNGIVLIDEVDLHLHPKWQRSLIEKFTATFPNCQFLLTTHSPLVISDSKDVLVYVMNDGELQEQDGLYGLDANQVLSSAMDTDIRNSALQSRLEDLQSSLTIGALDEARELYKTLADELPAGHIELAKASLLIRKLEVSRAKD